MKRADTKRAVKRTGNVRKDLTQNQLAWIASVALAYNEAERLIDVSLITSLSLGDIAHDVVGRINGIDGKIAIIKLAITELKCPTNIQHKIADSLGEGGFSLLKRYRDRIIHASIVDAAAAIAKTPASRGNFEEVLLTVSALKALYKRMRLVRLELIEVLKICGVLARRKYMQPIETSLSIFGVPDRIAERRKETEEEIRACFARFLRHQKARLSLPPLPQFPSEAELRAADEKAMQARQDDMMKRLGPLPEHLKNRSRRILHKGSLAKLMGLSDADNKDI